MIAAKRKSKPPERSRVAFHKRRDRRQAIASGRGSFAVPFLDRQRVPNCV
jgi:hypothetical protein